MLSSHRGREVAHLHHRRQPQDAVGEDLADPGDGLGQGGQVVAAQVHHGRVGHRQRRGRRGTPGTVVADGLPDRVGGHQRPQGRLALVAQLGRGGARGRDLGGQAGHLGRPCLGAAGAAGGPLDLAGRDGQQVARRQGQRPHPHRVGGRGDQRPGLLVGVGHANDDRDACRLVLLEDALHLPGDPADRPGCRHAPAPSPVTPTGRSYEYGGAGRRPRPRRIRSAVRRPCRAGR